MCDHDHGVIINIVAAAVLHSIAEIPTKRRALGKAASLALKHSLLGLLYITADRMPIPGKYLLIRTSIMPQRH